MGKELHHNKDAAWLQEEEKYVNKKVKAKEQSWQDIIEEKLDDLKDQKIEGPRCRSSPQLLV
eukprot:1960503-Ditylum_brightwellii.AAC.1